MCDKGAGVHVKEVDVNNFHWGHDKHESDAILTEVRLNMKSIKDELGSTKKILQDILNKEIIIMANLDALTAQVKANTEIEASAIVLLQGLAAKLAEIATDPVAVAALAEELKVSADALAAAVVANTPVE